MMIEVLIWQSLTTCKVGGNHRKPTQMNTKCTKPQTIWKPLQYIYLIVNKNFIKRVVHAKKRDMK